MACLAVFHLCLAKKLLACVVCNSRPFMPEPYLRWLETGVVQARQLSRWVPRRPEVTLSNGRHFALTG